MQKLTISDSWMLLPILHWILYRRGFGHSLLFCVLTIQCFPNSVKNLRTSQNFLTMQHTMTRITSMDTVLSVWCFVSQYEIKTGATILLSYSDTVCDRRKNPNCSWPLAWYAIMPEFSRKKNVIILCDNGYVKKDLVCLKDEFQNLDLIGNVRNDFVIYDFPPQSSGKRAYLPSMEKDCPYGRILCYPKIRLAVIIRSSAVPWQISLGKEKSLHIWQLQKRIPVPEDGSLVSFFPNSLKFSVCDRKITSEPASRRMQFIPLLLYTFRWNIEVSYYEQETIWLLCSYMVRTRKEIEMFVNLIKITYCAMKLYNNNIQHIHESVNQLGEQVLKGLKILCFWQ